MSDSEASGTPQRTAMRPETSVWDPSLLPPSGPRRAERAKETLATSQGASRGSQGAKSLDWFALWTRSRHEKHVRDQLAEKHIEVFLPTITKWSRWKDRKKRIDWPLFPGYCFARFDAVDRLPVLKCDGVVQIVGTEAGPSPIPEYEVDGIRQLVESELSYDPHPLIKEGEMVKVVSGPLRGVIGRLVRKGMHARLVLSVDLIGQAVSVEVDAADVRPG